jgi:Arc/MetJ family transcription regulator
MNRCMRTNIDISDDLLREARRYTRARTKKEIVEEALRVFVESKALELRKSSYRERLKSIEKKTERLILRESPGEILRKDRDRL